MVILSSRKFNKIKQRLIKDTRLEERYKYLEEVKEGRKERYPENTAIVSLTSYAGRLPKIHQAIESLLQQTMKPHKILLWLHESNKGTTLTAELQDQCTRGLEIRYCETDYGPYTKYFYTLKEYPDHPIITVDDDILYPLDTMEKLWEAYTQEPNLIHCHQAHYMKSSPEGDLLPYKQWERSTGNKEKGLRIFPTGVGGVIYPPGSLHEDALNAKLFMELCPKSDDVWLKAMSLLKKAECKKIPRAGNWEHAFLSILHEDGVTLKRQNKSKKHGNDSKIAKVMAHYKLHLP